MSLTCTFEEQEYRGGIIHYACKIKYQSVPSKVLKIHGNHQPGKTNDDVQEIRFVKCNIPIIPAGLTQIFPNMIDLSIWRSNLKLVTNNDLIEYQNIKMIYMIDNKIEFIPGNLFDGFKDLEEVGFNDNKLLMIEPNLLFGYDKLKVFDISDNPRYTTIFSLYDDDEARSTYVEVRSEIARVYGEHVEEHAILRKKFDEEVAGREYPTLENEIKLQSSLFRDLKAFIHDDTTKDFQIQINDHNFPVHKFLIAARSPTLAEILKTNPEVENLKLIDIPVDIFDVILKYFYTDELPGVDGMNFLHLFAAAGKLKIQEVKDYAARKLIDQIDKYNVMELLNMSNKYEHDELRHKAFDEIKKKYPKIIFKDKWETEPESVSNILKIYMKKEEAIRKLEEEFENFQK